MIDTSKLIDNYIFETLFNQGMDEAFVMGEYGGLISALTDDGYVEMRKRMPLYSIIRSQLLGNKYVSVSSLEKHAIEYEVYFVYENINFEIEDWEAFKFDKEKYRKDFLDYLGKEKIESLEKDIKNTLELIKNYNDTIEKMNYKIKKIKEALGITTV